MLLTKTDPPDPIQVPAAAEARLVERLLWVFMLSYAFDYRSTIQGTGGTSVSADQLVFLGLCLASSLAILWLGRRFLTVRPGGWLLLFWGAFLAWMLVNSALQGVQIGRSIRVAIPMVFCFLGMANAHIAGCVGIRPSAIVRPVLTAACINILWRIINGFLFQNASVETIRFEIQSPANNWLAAWIACAVLLRGRFHWSVIVACGTLFIGILITVTRSLFFPVAAAAVACSWCCVLGLIWRQFTIADLMRRLIPVSAVAALILLALGAAALVQPVLIERWNERLFHNTGTRNLSADVSYLTRKAEADAIWNILEKDPVHFIHGRGYGCSYYWDSAYLPEIWLVLPKSETEVFDIWFAGHSMWTYGLLSGGVIGVVAIVVLLISTMGLSLSAARANIALPGPDHWLSYLPFVATCCLLSETLTANPFQERLTGILFGMMAGLSQSFMIRSSWIHASPQASEA